MPNHLINETSPYLQQHADNPVNWYPWNEQALTLAREQDKPILLSIGYSACHWCHVMAHESFEDKDIAAIMNQHFINIKVDREERPDLDQIYQTAHQILSQRAGGWPLTVFLTPDQNPFFTGTYFPKTSRYNLPGFGELLIKIAEFYQHNREEIAKQNHALTEIFNETNPSSSHESNFDPALFDEHLKQLQRSFDARFGGFGDAPKFPHPMDLEFCLRRYAATGTVMAVVAAMNNESGSAMPVSLTLPSGTLSPRERGKTEKSLGATPTVNRDSLHMVTLTLERMARGGIYDQLGGGFHRYSVDAYWMIPHFEKMLYDNALLLKIYSDAWLITQNPLFKKVVEETAAWLMREMQSPEGGYYSTIDADSEHEEGKFYVWDREEVKQLLSEDEYNVIAAHYGFNNNPNFEGKYWHLNIYRDPEEISTHLNFSIEKCVEFLDSAKKKMQVLRATRVKPNRDEKILTSWNALTIAAMAHAAALFENKIWLDSARRALTFIRNRMFNERRLLATYKDSRAHLNAYLDDHAFLLNALIELLQTDFHPEDLRFAQQIANLILEKFEDKQAGGFFFTSNDHEKLIHRPKPSYDHATPSGNGIAAYALQRLGFITGETRYNQAAENTLKCFYPSLKEHSSGLTSLLMALEEFLTPTQLVLLRGELSAINEWLPTLRKSYQPHTLLIVLPATLTHLPSILAKEIRHPISAWVCRGTSCLPPIDNLAQLINTIQEYQ